jgi:hypothetical protein
MLKTHLQPIVAFLFNTPSNGRNDNSSQAKLNRDDYYQPMVSYYGVDSERDQEHKVDVAQGSSNHSDYYQPMVDYYFVDADQLDVNQSHTQSQRNASAPSGLAAFFSRLWRQLTTPNTEPRVRQWHDHSGQAVWETYDPLTDRHRLFFSEEEVYEWLERRYYE